MKLWQKSTTVDSFVESFTVGKDKELDVYLAKADILGSMAHVTMLKSIGLVEDKELKLLLSELRHLYLNSDNFVIEENVEDVHSQVELMLTRKLGDIGKKIHSGRSRNDQVLVDLKLFSRHALKEIVKRIEQLFNTLITLSERYKDILLPGYTHLQVAMPSSFGLWFGAYAESLVDDMRLLKAAYDVCNRNPLGSAAGYGSSFPLNRQLTTDLLGFDGLNYNVVYAQMGRGKMEKTVSNALASVATTVSRLAMDACLYSSQNFGFIKLPDEFTTGSSIMPHKKNPDVFELTRAKCNRIQAVPQDITLITNNLPSGYFRDMQLIKECYMPIFEDLSSCLDITTMMLESVTVNPSIAEDDKYQYMFSVERVNEMVLQGIPFREAYKKVGFEIEAGAFVPSTDINHTHEGSIGNLCNDKIQEMMTTLVNSFNFKKMDKAIANLING